MGIRYQASLRGVTADSLTGFFVGWPNPPTPATRLKLLRNSDMVVLAVGAGSGKVVGFITAITDEVLSAYIPFLEVLPGGLPRRFFYGCNLIALIGFSWRCTAQIS